MVTASQSWQALDAAIEAAVNDRGLSETTLSRYAHTWGRWTAFCEQFGEHPLSAPYSVFEAYVAESFDLGRTAGTVRVFFTGVHDGYRQSGLTPATEEPAHAAAWRELLRGYARASQAPGRGRARAMLREDLVALLSAPAPATARELAAATALLVGIETGASSRDLHALTAAEVVSTDAGTQLAGVRLDCRCGESSVAGTGCAACAVTELARVSAANRRLFADASPSKAVAGLTTLFRRQAGRWRGLSVQSSRASGAVLSETEPLDARARDGLMAGLHLRATATGLRDAQARAWLVLAWCAGLRGGSDLQGVRRGHVQSEEDGQAFPSALIVRLGRTKSDPAGERRPTIRLERENAGALCPVVVVETWLRIRDAMASDSPQPLHPLFSSAVLKGYDPAVPIHDPFRWFRHDLRRLGKRAGMTGRHFTPHSPRRGYATQADRDGRDIVAIQRGLRHRSLATTSLYVDGASAASRRLLGGSGE